MLSEMEVYSKLYYQTKLKDQIEAEMAKREVDAKDILKTRNEIMRKLYEEEGEEVKEAVVKERERLKEEKVADEAILQSILEDAETDTPESRIK